MNKIAALLLVVAAVLSCGIASARQTVIYALSGTSTEINSGVTVEVTEPMRVQQILIKFAASATGSVSLKIDSGYGSDYDTTTDTSSLNSDSYYYNKGDNNPHLYKKVQAVPVYDKLIIDGTSVDQAFHALIYMEPE